VQRGGAVWVGGVGGRAQLKERAHGRRLRRVGCFVQRPPAGGVGGGEVGARGCQLAHAPEYRRVYRQLT